MPSGLHGQHARMSMPGYQCMCVSHVHRQTCAYTWVHTCVHICMRARRHPCVHIGKHANMHGSAQMHVCPHKCIYTHPHTHTFNLSSGLWHRGIRPKAGTPSRCGARGLVRPLARQAAPSVLPGGRAHHARACQDWWLDTGTLAGRGARRLLQGLLKESQRGRKGLRAPAAIPGSSTWLWTP